MPFNEPRFPYVVLELIARVWKRRPGEVEQPPLEVFRFELLRLSKKTGYARQFLLANWRDLRLAIEECWKSEQASASIPYFLASLFLQSATRPKDAAETILTDSEKLDG